LVAPESRALVREKGAADMGVSRVWFELWRNTGEGLKAIRASVLFDAEMAAALLEAPEYSEVRKYYLDLKAGEMTYKVMVCGLSAIEP